MNLGNPREFTILELSSTEFLDPCAERDDIILLIAARVVDDQFSHVLFFGNIQNTVNFCNDSRSLRFPGFEKLFHAGKTLDDIFSGHTAEMEGPEGKLRARLAN